jgi:hypothetical protein
MKIAKTILGLVCSLAAAYFIIYPLFNPVSFTEMVLGFNVSTQDVWLVVYILLGMLIITSYFLFMAQEEIRDLRSKLYKYLNSLI